MSWERMIEEIKSAPQCTQHHLEILATKSPILTQLLQRWRHGRISYEQMLLEMICRMTVIGLEHEAYLMKALEQKMPKVQSGLFDARCFPYPQVKPDEPVIQ